jgi:NodT family efflux transporter outer membrane factor (OMF) lipoprotein
MPDQTPLAHQGKPENLLQWWDGFQDPTLKHFIDEAEKVSASVSSAGAKIAQARAGLIGSDAALLPSLDGSLGTKTSSFSFGGPPFIWTQHQIGLQSNWEIDLFGGLARQQEAARSQLESRTASWHDARVAVAVEVANAYLAYRYCEVQKQLSQADANSRKEAARLTEIAAQHGFRAPADVALTQAAAADGNRSFLQYQAQCERSIKGLVALTALEETDVRQSLNSIPEKVAQLPTPPAFTIAAVPARVLLQRPDIAAAERDMAEASAKIGVEQAKRYPKLSLSGNITPTLQNVNGGAFMLAQTWSIGPTLSLPLFDLGKRAADVENARSQYEATVSNYRSKVRTAVQEVEEALVRLDSAAKRLPEAQQAYGAYQARLTAAEKLYQVGLSNLIDLETTRRSVLTANLTVKELEQERVSAWIALYRAAGGGWESPEHALPTAPPPAAKQEISHETPTLINPQPSAVSGESS